MGRKCFVPHCKSGYRSCAEEISLFKAPSDPDRLALWDRAIARPGRRLGPRDNVCAKHFPPHFVSRAYYSELGGEVVLNAPKRARLSPEAVPSIFLDLEPPMKPRKERAKRTRTTTELGTSRRSTKKARTVHESSACMTGSGYSVHHAVEQDDQSTVQVKSEPLTPERSGCEETSVFTSHSMPSVESADKRNDQSAEILDTMSSSAGLSEYILPDIPSVSTPVMKQEPQDVDLSSKVPSETAVPATKEPFFVFSKLLDATRSVSLPSKAWAVHVVDGFAVKKIVFTELAPTLPTGEPVQLKTLCVSPMGESALNVKTFILGRPVECKAGVRASLATSMADLSKAVQLFHEMRVCAGGPHESTDAKVVPQNAYVDRRNVWRHRNCELYSTSERCLECTGLYNSCAR